MKTLWMFEKGSEWQVEGEPRFREFHILPRFLQERLATLKVADEMTYVPSCGTRFSATLSGHAVYEIVLSQSEMYQIRRIFR